VMGITEAPVFERIDRHIRAMPQYLVGHLERVTRIRDRAARIPGLHLAGAAYDGMGIPDCVQSGVTAAAALVSKLRNRSQEPATITT
jgi:oxygen-dependent protoporphyrinogen oxidase